MFGDRARPTSRTSPLFSERSYDELSVGDRWGPFVESLDQATSDELRGAIGTTAPGAGAPLGVLPLVTLRVLRRALEGIIPGGVLARQTFSVFDELPAAGDISVMVSLSGQQRRPSGLLHDVRVHALVRGQRPRDRRVDDHRAPDRERRMSGFRGRHPPDRARRDRSLRRDLRRQQPVAHGSRVRGDDAVQDRDRARSDRAADGVRGVGRTGSAPTACHRACGSTSATAAPSTSTIRSPATPRTCPTTPAI